jgi:UDP-2-acetamido-2-deoxy-ribo-hexuluronate aminotransferase
MDTLQAAIVLSKLEIFDEEVALRWEIGQRYSRLINESDAGKGRSLTPPVVEAGNRSVFAQYTVEVDGRDAVQASMSARGVPTAVHYPIPLHLQPAFARSETSGEPLRVSERAASRVLSLPMHPYLGETDQETVIRVLCDSVRNA